MSVLNDLNDRQGLCEDVMGSIRSSLLSRGLDEAGAHLILIDSSGMLQFSTLSNEIAPAICSAAAKSISSGATEYTECKQRGFGNGKFLPQRDRF